MRFLGGKANVKYLRTSDLARAVGIHENTVRRYVDWGLLPPVERGSNGYRRFTQKHLDCLRLARMVFSTSYPGKAIRHSAGEIIEIAVADDWGGALERAYAHLTFVQTERILAETAAMLLERWAKGISADATTQPMQIGQVSKLLGVSIDILRNWESNGLITIPRNDSNGYRRYGSKEISRLRVIRMLSRAGYSQMAILRMMLQLDKGITSNLRQSLDTPLPDEDVYTAADRWQSTLTDEENLARRLIALIEEIIAGRTEHKPSK
jgi:DNA-binding transcriptional MerR regulator